MPYLSAGLKAHVDGIAAAGTRIAFHTADPGTTAANEVSGTGRPATTWGAGADTTVSGKAGYQRPGSQVTAPIPAGTTVTHWSLQSAATGNTTLYTGALPAAEAFGSAGTLQFTPTLLTYNE